MCACERAVDGQAWVVAEGSGGRRCDHRTAGLSDKVECAGGRRTCDLGLGAEENHLTSPPPWTAAVMVVGVEVKVGEVGWLW